MWHRILQFLLEHLVKELSRACNRRRIAWIIVHPNFLPYGHADLQATTEFDSKPAMRTFDRAWRLTLHIALHMEQVMHTMGCRTVIRTK